MSDMPAPEPPTTPSWYEGETPWTLTTRGMKLYESVQAGTIETLLETLHELELTLGPPIEQTLPTLIAVLEFAGRKREDVELAAALRWMEDCGILKSIAPISLPQGN